MKKDQENPIVNVCEIHHVVIKGGYVFHIIKVNFSDYSKELYLGTKGKLAFKFCY